MKKTQCLRSGKSKFIDLHCGVPPALVASEVVVTINQTRQLGVLRIERDISTGTRTRTSIRGLKTRIVARLYGEVTREALGSVVTRVQEFEVQRIPSRDVRLPEHRSTSEVAKPVKERVVCLEMNVEGERRLTTPPAEFRRLALHKGTRRVHLEGVTRRRLRVHASEDREDSKTCRDNLKA